MVCKTPSIAIYANDKKPRAVEVAKELLAGPVGEHACVGEVIIGDLEADTIKHCGYLMVVGGDGTILSAVRSLNGFQIPIIGVNVGKLGFLARFSIEELVKEFDTLVSAGLNVVTDHELLMCELYGPEGVVDSSLVVNEVAVVAGPPFRMIDLSISIGKDHLSNCAGDGMIISTPIGSTAYNLSAGGPILGSGLETIVITPLAAHSLNFRPVVVGNDQPIKLCCNSRDARVLIDGQVDMTMGKDQHIVITRADFGFKLVQNPKYSQWQVLNQKLHWGRLPDYNNIG